VRSVDGTGLVVCAPSVSPRRFTDPTLDQGEDGQILLTTLAAFEHPATAVSSAGGCLSQSSRSSSRRRGSGRPDNSRYHPRLLRPFVSVQPVLLEQLAHIDPGDARLTPSP
jgi:hypothetical protein